MSATTVKKVMQQRLTRGATVICSDSLAFSEAKLRGKTMLVTSKGPVKCNGKGRCAGDWCVGLAVFIADAKIAKKDKKMGWRKGTHKVCLTHLKDKDRVLLVPPPLLAQETSVLPSRPKSRLKDVLEEVAPTNGHASDSDEVTWDDLARAHQAGDITKLALLARRLKAQTESLKSRVIENQTRLIESLSGK